MILCRECGNSAPSRDGFCSSCGALLDWSGERVETQVLPTVSAVPAATAPEGVAEKPWQATVTPEAVEPAGRLPGAEARRTEPVPLAAEPGYTGPYCQACGVRNPEDRTFCRSCGAPLQPSAAASTQRRGWWRRMIDRLLRRRRQFAAGQRPTGFRDHHGAGNGASHRRRLRLSNIKVSRVAPILIVAGLAGVGLGPARGWVTNEVNSLFGKAKSKVSEHFVNVTPVGASAASEKSHGAGLAVDGLNNTYWASTQHRDGTGDTITVSFASPVDIDQIGILSGADAQNFRASARPHDLVVSATGVPDTVLTFDDTADFQSRAITLRHVTKVTFTVKDSYPGQKQHDLAIRDIEFFVKSS